MGQGKDFSSLQITCIQYFAAAYRPGQNLVVATDEIQVCLQNAAVVCMPPMIYAY